MLTQSSAANQAHLRSHSSPRAGQALHRSPTAPEFQLQPEVFRSTLLERLRLPLHMAEATCECGGHHDLNASVPEQLQQRELLAVFRGAGRSS